MSKQVKAALILAAIAVGLYLLWRFLRPATGQRAVLDPSNSPEAMALFVNQNPQLM